LILSEPIEVDEEFSEGQDVVGARPLGLSRWKTEENLNGQLNSPVDSLEGDPIAPPSINSLTVTAGGDITAGCASGSHDSGIHSVGGDGDNEEEHVDVDGDVEMGSKSSLDADRCAKRKKTCDGTSVGVSSASESQVSSPQGTFYLLTVCISNKCVGEISQGLIWLIELV
jgi:hypothetical protein